MSENIYHLKTIKYQNKLDLLKGKNSYIVLESYTKAIEKISTKHTLCGHIWRVSPNNLLKSPGQVGCPKCSGRIGTSFKYFKKELDMIHNGTIGVIETTYRSLQYNSEFYCNVDVSHKNWITRASSVLRGSGCNLCSMLKTNISQRTPLNVFKRDILLILHQNKIGILDKTYSGMGKRATFYCKENTMHNNWTTKPADLKRGTHCPACSRHHCIKTTSKGEKEVANFVKSIYSGVIIENDRTILNPKELDIYLPEIGFAVEYNGDYWHSKKPVGYHRAKTAGCESRGIKLIHIWESDWKSNKEYWEAYLKGFIVPPLSASL